MSLPPPADDWTTRVTSRSGYSWAAAVPNISALASAVRPHSARVAALGFLGVIPFLRVIFSQRAFGVAVAGRLIANDVYRYTCIQNCCNPPSEGTVAARPPGACAERRERAGGASSEERRVGTECVRTCRCWWSPDH